MSLLLTILNVNVCDQSEKSVFQVEANYVCSYKMNNVITTQLRIWAGVCLWVFVSSLQSVKNEHFCSLTLNLDSGLRLANFLNCSHRVNIYVLTFKHNQTIQTSSSTNYNNISNILGRCWCVEAQKGNQTQIHFYTVCDYLRGILGDRTGD